MYANPKNITKQDITDYIRARRLFKHNIKQIFVTNIRAISYRDVLELYLYISGQRDYQWKDITGEILPKQSIIKTVLNLFKDLLAWPFLYWFHARKTTLLKKLCKPQETIDGFEQKFNSILFLRTDHWFNLKNGGSVGHLSGVINGFRTLGKQVQVVSSDYLVGVEKDDNFQIYSPTYELGRNLPNIPEFIYNKQLIQCLESKFENYYPSFIYQRYSLSSYVGVYLKTKYKIPYVCEYNGSFIWMGRNWGKRFFHEKLIHKIELLNLNAADLVVVVSQAMKNELLKRGIKEHKILVNPNGVDPEKYSPAISGNAIRKKYHLDNKLVVGFIGTFGQWHGVVEMAQAIVRFFELYPDTAVRFLLIGDGVLMPQVQQVINQSLYHQNVILTGSVAQEKGANYLAACDIFLSPHIPNPDGSKFFGSPTKLFEYMGMGKAIIASDLEQIGEVLEHDKTAYLVPPGDVEALANAIAIVADKKTLRIKLGKNARQEVVVKYTWERHVERILEKIKTCQR